jgi:hypothetical protein
MAKRSNIASVRPRGAPIPMSGPTDVVIAGTKPFALALFAPVTERAGTRPRIAPEPSAALTLCAESSGVLVVEYEPRWLPALTQLRQQRPGLRVVAALAPGQEGAAQSLGPLLIDAVPWDGRAVSVLPAIERAIGGTRGPVAAPAAAGVPPPAPPPVPAPPSPGVNGAGSATLDLFGDLGATAATPFPASLAAVPAAASEPEPLDLFTDLGATEATPFPASLAAVVGPSLGASGPAAWPANGPSAGEAEAMLRDALAGAGGLSTHRAVVEQAIAGLSVLEREVFLGGAPAIDAGPIRHAAVLRLRVAVALATRPPPGAAVDGAAVAELLSEIDRLLGAVKGLLDAAPLEAQASLEAIRNALVKEAVDFSEASHQMGLAGSATIAARSGASRPSSATRVVAVRSGVSEPEAAERRRSRVAWVVLAVAVLGAAAFHGYRWKQKEQAVAELKTYPGQPDGMRLLPAPPGATTRELVPLQGRPDRAQVEKFKEQQRLLGKTVTETGVGGLLIRSDAPVAPAGDRKGSP